MFDLSKLKICFIAGTLTQGGAERQLYYILKSLINLGTNVHLVCLTEKEYWEDRILHLGVPISWVGRSRFRPMRLISILLNQHKSLPNIIQSQHFYTNLYAVAASRILGSKEIGAIRNDAKFEVRANGPLYGKLSLRSPRAIMANSHKGIQNAIGLGVPAKRLHFVPNVVDCEHFKPLGKKHSKAIKIISVGRLAEQKRFDRFIRIVAKINKETSHLVKGIIVGDGPQKNDLVNQIRQLDLPPNSIEISGAVSNTNELYRKADIFLLTSDWEGTPNVLLEAMASGLPIVASRVGGVPDLIQDGDTGFLANPQKIDSFITPLLRLMNYSELRQNVVRNARKYVIDHHSPDLLPTRLCALYEKILR